MPSCDMRLGAVEPRTKQVQYFVGNYLCYFTLSFWKFSCTDRFNL